MLETGLSGSQGPSLSSLTDEYLNTSVNTCCLLHKRSKLFSFLPIIPLCLFQVLPFVLVSTGSDPRLLIAVGIAVSLWCGFAEEAEAVERMEQEMYLVT